MARQIGILTAGGDSPGLNAAIRGVGKAALGHHKMHVVGFRDGFRGLMENRIMALDGGQLSGILTTGGTILGTSRDKPHKMPVGGKDVWGSDTTFGFDTALGIATECIDRLHSTAHSHHRIIVVEIMGHRAGWLALGAGIAGGADVILIPEIPYNIESIAEAIRDRARGGKPFSIVAVAEGAISKQDLAAMADAKLKKKAAKEKAKANPKSAKQMDDTEADAAELIWAGRTLRLAQRLEKLTGLEARLTILGHLQRGGTPSAADRILATRLGTAAADLIAKKQYGVLVASHGEGTKALKIEDCAGKVKIVPPDHPLVLSARRVGTNFGD